MLVLFMDLIIDFSTKLKILITFPLFSVLYTLVCTQKIPLGGR